MPRDMVGPGYTYAQAQAAHDAAVAGPGYVPGPQRAMGGDPQRSHTIPASQSTFTYNGQVLDLNALRQQTMAFGRAGYAQQQEYVAGLQEQLASQPANYGYDANTNAALDAYIKSGGTGEPEDYGLGANLLNTPGFEDPLGTQAARINAREQANSPEVLAIAQQQYEDVRSTAMAQTDAFNRQHNPYYEGSISEKQGENADRKYTYKGESYSYEDLPFIRSAQQSPVDAAVAEVTDSQEARNQDDFSGAANASFQFELQRPPDQLYYIQSLGQCLDRKYSGSGIFVDD